MPTTFINVTVTATFLLKEHETYCSVDITVVCGVPTTFHNITVTATSILKEQDTCFSVDVTVVYYCANLTS